MSEKIWGKHPVLEALKSQQNRIDKIFLAKNSGTFLQEIEVLAKSYDVEISYEDNDRLKELCGHPKHQGVVALLSSATSYLDPLDLVLKAKHLKEPPFIIILDHLQDPHNLGAILRTAEGSGCHGVVIPLKRGVGLTETVSKTSAGASSYVAVACVTNINQAIDLFKKEGIWVVGADGEAQTVCFDHDFTLPTCLVLGGEGKGLSRLTREKCDFLVKIPMAGKIASLNVSNAGAVLMYELVRQRTAAGIITR